MQTVTQAAPSRAQMAREREDQKKRMDHAVANFKMPRVVFGQFVRWWKNADTTRAPQLGRVDRIGTNALVVVINGMEYTSVHHVNDPVLVVNEKIRARGGWDYTEEDIEAEAKEKATEARFDKLESAVGALADAVSKLSPSKGKSDNSK